MAQVRAHPHGLSGRHGQNHSRTTPLTPHHDTPPARTWLQRQLLSGCECPRRQTRQTRQRPRESFWAGSAPGTLPKQPARLAVLAESPVRERSAWSAGPHTLPDRPAPSPFLSPPSMVPIARVLPLLTVCRRGSGITSAWVGGSQMNFYTILDQVIDLLRQRQRVSYRALKRQFQLDDDYLEDLKVELIRVQQLAVDQEGEMLVWTGNTGLTAPPPATPVQTPERVPLTYTPPYLAEKILTSRSALEGERKQVTVLFADLKGSMELLADRDP